MNDPKRPKDIIDHIEAIAAEHGHFEPVDENYYHAFVELNQRQIEKLAIALMLDQEKEVRRLAGGKADSAAVARVSKSNRNMFTGISLGFARFDEFGNFGFVARIPLNPRATHEPPPRSRFRPEQPVIGRWSALSRHRPGGGR